jgi:putative DNA primase/helicase
MMPARDDEASSSKVVPLKAGADPSLLSVLPGASGGGGEPLPPKGKRKKPPPDWLIDVVRLTTNFALIYGTDTVFDGDERMLIRIGPLRHAYGKAVKEWLQHPERKTIRQEEVVFDPRHPDRPWNLFGGLPSVPKLGKCNLILELVDYLVGGNPALRDWVLKWIAYPLQHVGAKMATSIVMRGPQGGGKNMLWECVRDIYGIYGTLITQSELESQYNDWMSARLFIIGNEVLSRREKWQLGGKLKNLVTEAQIPIQAKYMPGRLESNHCNLVFLSNDLLPVPLEESNRRYLVIDAPHEHPDGKEFYTAVAEQIANGGREAFHDYLLNLSLGDFNPHTKPLSTEAFQEALELSLSPSELFTRRWKAGDMSALQSGESGTTVWAGAIEDLYIVFRRWCEREGERHVDTQTRFARTLAVGGIRKRRLRLSMEGRERQHRVYWIDERVPDACEDVEQWIRTECGSANGCAVAASSK